MKSDVIRMMTVAVAVSVPQDEVAFAMLNHDYIEGFEGFYRDTCLKLKRSQRSEIPVVLGVMINYAIKELPILIPGCQALADLGSPAKLTEITGRFLTEDIASMLSSLAKRDTIRSCIKQFLHIKDKNNMYALIESTKFEAIFTDFMKIFEESSAANFGFTGTFQDYVLHCFTHFYYPGHKREIWQNLRATDFARRESEQNITTAKILTPIRRDDLLIRNQLINISEVSDLMFNHSGQSEDARGVSYDIFYLIMNYLCEQKVTALNERLDTFKLLFVDTQDRRSNRYSSIPENKSIASKINNAKMLIPFLFEAIRKDEWSLNNLTELRAQCFELGKKDRDGKNCVWKDVQEKAETSRYFDVRGGGTAHNYKAFDQIFKGVLSVHALMKAFEERGMCVVDTFDRVPTLFRDKRIPRGMDYLSSLQYVGTMLDLQDEGEHLPISSGDLLKFDDMVSEYAGSIQNNRGNIRRNRYLAISRGFDDNSKLKKKGELQSPFERLHSVADYMTAVPHGYEEYIFSWLEDNNNDLSCFPYISPMITLESGDVVAGKYSSLYNNKFFTTHAETAKYYLAGLAQGEKALEDYSWHIGTSLYSGYSYTRVENTRSGQVEKRYFLLYIPMEDKFLYCPEDSEDARAPQFYCRDLSELQREINDSCFNGRCNAWVDLTYAALPPYIFNNFIKGDGGVDGQRYTKALDMSMGFDTFIGIENLNMSEVTKRLDSINVYPEYRSSVDRYVRWLGELSLIQNSYIDLLQTMLSYSLYVIRAPLSSITGNDMRNGQILIESLLKSEFKENNLEWFFSKLDESLRLGVISKINTRWGTTSSNGGYQDVDLSCLNLIYGTAKQVKDKDTLMYDLIDALSEYSTPAQRFVQLYNFVNTKLSFLRLLRDAYDLLFNVIIVDLSTLCCELNARFEVEATLVSSKDNIGNGGLSDIKFALLDSLTNDDIMNFVGRARRENWQNFSILCDGILSYFKQSRQEISNLVDYDISASPSTKSRFQEFGSMFFLIGMYTEPLVRNVLQDITDKCLEDDAGFLLCKNSYFKGISGKTEYYVHRTGHMLEVTGSEMKPVTFDFSKESDRRFYESIIKDGKSRNVW